MNNNKLNTLLLTVVGVATLLVVIMGASFAYFTATISGTETESTVNVGAGVLSISYAGGAEIETPLLIPLPAGTAAGEKIFTITGTNSTATKMPYEISMVVTKNTFTTDTITYTLTPTNTGGNGSLADPITTPKGILNTDTMLVIPLGNGFFTGVVTNNVHTYSLKIYFDDNLANQDVDKDKVLEAYVNTTVSSIL